MNASPPFRVSYAMSVKQRLGVGGVLCLFLISLACRIQPVSPTPGNPLSTPARLTDTPATPAGYPAQVNTLPPPVVYPSLDTPIPTAYPVATLPVPSPTPPVPSPTLPADSAYPTGNTYLPLIGVAEAPPTASLPLPTPTPYPTVDFAAMRAQLQAADQEIGYNKIGFHVGVGGNSLGIGEWMRRLDPAGVPFFLKSVDNSGPILEAIGLKLASGVDHTLVFRTTGNDVPDYSLPAVTAARLHWQWHRDRFPAELEPYKDQIWLETMNELDKNLSEWLAEFSLEQARLAQQAGFRWAAFGWSPGEPEPEDWAGPKMLQFLRLAGSNPDRIAIAVHESSLIADDITDGYPFKIGRFLSLFDICDQNGIPRPTVLMTEWGWQSHDLPDPEKALRDISWAAKLYAAFPQVKGGAIWYLGIGYEPIQNQTQQLIVPVTEFSLTHYYAIPAPPAQAATDPNLYRP